jgi:citrate synthase
MSKKTIEEIIATTFEIAPSRVKSNSSRKNISEWDSLGHIHLMVALEEEFEVVISAVEFSELRTVEEVRYFIDKLL